MKNHSQLIVCTKTGCGPNSAHGLSLLTAPGLAHAIRQVRGTAGSVRPGSLPPVQHTRHITGCDPDGCGLPPLTLPEDSSLLTL